LKEEHTSTYNARQQQLGYVKTLQERHRFTLAPMPGGYGTEHLLLSTSAMREVRLEFDCCLDLWVGGGLLWVVWQGDLFCVLVITGR